MSKMIRLGRQIFALVCLVTGFVVIGGEPTGAIPCQATHQTFYSDASCTQAIGTRDVTCSGINQSGQTCGYRIIEWLDCCGGCTGEAECQPYGQEDPCTPYVAC
jgi:hypothetical protein